MNLSDKLAFRLMETLQEYGSIEYSMIWKERVTPAGRWFFQLVPSARRISGNDCFGWPTPAANEYETQDPNLIAQRRLAAKEKHHNNGFGMTLGQTVAGWPTATAKDADSAGNRPDPKDKSLTDVAQMAGWPTPNAMPENRGGLQANPEAALKRRAEGHMLNLDDAATLAGWATPRVTDGSKGGPNQAGGALSHDASLAGWATPTAPRAHDSDETAGRWYPETKNQADPVLQLLGRERNSSSASTEKRGALNPEFSLWLQGYPSAWNETAPDKKFASRRRE